MSASGLIANAPSQPTPELLGRIVELFGIDAVLVLDDESLFASLQGMLNNF